MARARARARARAMYVLGWVRLHRDGLGWAGLGWAGGWLLDGWGVGGCNVDMSCHSVVGVQLVRLLQTEWPRQVLLTS